MIRLIICIPFLILLFACSSSSTYKSDKRSGFGYASNRLAPQHYQVSFTARGGDRELALKMALRHASELTLAQGYSWFALLEEETRTLHNNYMDKSQIANNESGIRKLERNCGVQGCGGASLIDDDFAYRSPSLGLGNSRSKVVVDLKIKLLDKKGTTKGSYSARDYLKTYESTAITQ